MLPTPVLRLLNILDDASLQSEEDFEGQYSILLHFVSFLKCTGEDTDRGSDLR